MISSIFCCSFFLLWLGGRSEKSSFLGSVDDAFEEDDDEKDAIRFGWEPWMETFKS